MNLSAKRVATLLAASNLGERDLREFIDAVLDAGPYETMRYLQSLKSHLRKMESYDDVESRSSFAAPNLKVIDEIIRLLTVEAKLSPRAAAEELTKSINGLTGKRSKLPLFRPKSGLGNWLKQLVDASSPSEVLHHAVSVRNAHAHGGAQSDWPLKARTR